MLDKGMIAIDEDMRILGMQDAELSIDKAHELDTRNLEYHRVHIYLS